MEVLVRDGRLYLRRFGSELPITRIGEGRYSVQPEGAPQPQEFLNVPPAEGRAGYLQMNIWTFRREEPFAPPLGRCCGRGPALLRPWRGRNPGCGYGAYAAEPQRRASRCLYVNPHVIDTLDRSQ
jgi:hypothetical protein